ncbi:DUF86 domain-containing protein [Candidatus Gottesmanbacteria bacterium]|nr:DUF86 domain-containing protein [Candidatus Gottesmanbacteria bacterium]
MERKIDRPYLLHIRDAIALIETWVSEKTFDDFTRDAQMQSAVIRQLEIIGEAARNVSPERKVATPQIPWRPIMDARNTLIHGYFTVDEKKVWDMVLTDIPVLKQQILLLLEDLEKEE